MVELLLRYGADASQRVDGGCTALQLAHFGTPRILELLIKHGAEVNTCERSGCLALWCASGFNAGEAEDTVRMLLELGADVQSKNDLGETALFPAAERGYCRVIKLLLEYGADIQARNNFGRSVLSAAIDSGYYQRREPVPLLLDHGVDLHSQDSAGDSALTLAAAAKARWERWGSYDEKGELMGMGTRRATAHKRNLTRIQLLLDHGASVDLINKAGDTALTLAAAHGKLDAVKFLLDRGANTHAKNEAGDTALSIATEIGYSEIRQLLLELPCEPNQAPVGSDAE